MKLDLEKIIAFLKKIENLTLVLIFFLLVLLSIALFTSEFNRLKTYIIFSLFIAGSSLGILVYANYFKKGKEEKKSAFTLIEGLLDFLNEGITIYDDEFKIVFVNKAFSKIVNLEKSDLLNLKIQQSMINNEKYEMLANIFFPFLKGENIKIISQNPEIIEVKFSSPQEKYFLISYLNILLDKEMFKMRIVLDETETIIENQKRLEFIRLVSHNLLTPLSEIRWLLESINLSELSEENKKTITSALNAINSTLKFNEIILAMLRTESKRLELKIENINFEEVIRNVLEILEERIKNKNLKITLTTDDQVKSIPGDKNLVSMMFYALIENAVLYNKENGEILISVQKIPHRPYAQIIIQDTGIGMSKEDLENLFKKYYRGKKTKNINVSGFGIGLYTAKSILDLHSAEVKVESEEDKGTKFYIIWPLDANLIIHK